MIFQQPVPSNSDAHSAKNYYSSPSSTHDIHHGLELRHPTTRIVWITSFMICDHTYDVQNSESIMRTIGRSTYGPWHKYYQPQPYCPEFCSRSIITISSAVYVAKVLNKLNCSCMFKVLTHFFLTLFFFFFTLYIVIQLLKIRPTECTHLNVIIFNLQNFYMFDT
jgi:hypothetical protein